MERVPLAMAGFRFSSRAHDHCRTGNVQGFREDGGSCVAARPEWTPWRLRRSLRDRHVVRRGEKAVYEGEPIYCRNSFAKQVEYFCITVAGGHGQGRKVAR